MNAQEQATNRKNEQRVGSPHRKIRLRHAALFAFIGAIAVVATTVVMIGGSAPAHACLLPGIPC
ncbi:MAG: hypothetical protein OXP75_01910 [Rhodospirillales bacterium]|nr:hypothetical protein [Rhodospirillales bacterium]